MAQFNLTRSTASLVAALCTVLACTAFASTAQASKGLPAKKISTDAKEGRGHSAETGLRQPPAKRLTPRLDKNGEIERPERRARR
jgi:hypothetical protein